MPFHLVNWHLLLRIGAELDDVAASDCLEEVLCRQSKSDQRQIEWSGVQAWQGKEILYTRKVALQTCLGSRGHKLCRDPFKTTLPTATVVLTT